METLLILAFLGLCGFGLIALMEAILGDGKKKKKVPQNTPPSTLTNDELLYEGYALMLAYHLGLGEIYANFKNRYTHASTDSLLEMTTRGECEVFSIAGINYRGDITSALGTKEAQLVPEPTNPHDPNAIRIELADGTHVGYIPANQTSEAAQLIKAQAYTIIRRTETYFFGQIYIKLQ